MTNRRATISDVAREANVSPSTASVVFSGKTPVSDATRERVLAAAAALGYAGPDPLAASLRRGRSGIVGVVVGSSLNSIFIDPVQRLLMDGLAEAVAPLGAGLLLLRSTSDIENAPTLTTAPVDAAVLIGCDAELRDSLDDVRARGIPIVVIEGDAGAGVPRVRLDNREAQRLAAGHLRELGHTDVAIVTLRTDPSGTLGRIEPGRDITIDVTRERLEGARDVYPDAIALATSGSTIDDGLAAARTLFADPRHRPTAVIAQSDLLATGVIRAAEEAGLRVPEDVSITGFDGVPVDGLAPYRLTTLVQAATEKGRAAGAAVAAMLEGEEPASVLLTCEFRLGNTSGPAPAPR
ncbi:MAG: transcriptional regulator [Microbacterium sp. SCN 70-200]|uniref:LacI family DNA-binding transcriptional regulator n=1 Tax=unclassified Microbacterium TaxID=2609290 RepID=UPI00086AA1FB|nr:MULTISPECIES: LacI family DNA-binding transcriptional regulator [unclassified Microbacterium]MBN9215142.1 LacI family DNA-binding transcriptional regulator [Microbacterium sp.]ODT42566.1 MAG: transcriptional regulator [Microbacterium sp. SCN 70-200]OJV80091.1 MAG: transcriptional regulator [Microbacterium sp. 70-16]